MFYFIPDRITVKFPYSPAVSAENNGVLEPCVEHLFSRERMDSILCKMIKCHPYVEGAAYIDVPIMWQDEEGNKGMYHEMRFLNDNVSSQLRGNPAIQFEK